LQLPSLLPSLRDCYRPSTLAEESTQKKEKAEKNYGRHPVRSCE
jgi:hypothetical protein